MEKKAYLFFLFLILLSGEVIGEITNSEYYFVIQENGNTIVGINLIGSGELSIPLQEDVENIYVKGGLYIKDINKMTIAIGSTQSAAIVYQTALLTEKVNNEWSFSTRLEDQTNKTIIVALPSNAIIRASEPSAFIESGEIMKLYWENIPNNQINLNYSFPKEVIPIDEIPVNEDKNSDNNAIKINNENIKEKTDNNMKIPINFTDIVDINTNKEDDRLMRVFAKKNKKDSFNLYWIILPIFFVLLLFYILFINKTKINKKSGRQMQVMQTLTKNETDIVDLLLSEKKLVKRSFMEKKLNIAKSSLAATLNNLERKKIIDIDRTYNSHTIKLTDWFNKL